MNIGPEYKMMKNTILNSLLIGCFLFSLIWHYLKSNVVDSKTTFPFIPIVVQLFCVILCIASMDQIFSFIIWISDSLAQLIYSGADYPIEGDQNMVMNDSGLDWWGIKATFSSIVIALGQFLFVMARFVIIYLRILINFHLRSLSK